MFHNACDYINLKNIPPLDLLHHEVFVLSPNKHDIPFKIKIGVFRILSSTNSHANEKKKG